MELVKVRGAAMAEAAKSRPQADEESTCLVGRFPGCCYWVQKIRDMFEKKCAIYNGWGKISHLKIVKAMLSVAGLEQFLGSKRSLKFLFHDISTPRQQLEDICKQQAKGGEAIGPREMWRKRI